MKRVFTSVLFLLFVIFLNAQNVTSGLLGYYSFDGNANDASGNGFNGIATDITYVADHNGVAGRAASFNGSSSKIVTMLHQKGLQEYTISAWIKVPVAGGNIIVCHKGVSGQGDGFAINHKAFGLDGDYALRFMENKTTIPADNWYHLTGTWKGNMGTNIDQSQMKLYINGLLVNNINISSAADTRAVPFDEDTALVIGRHSGWNQWFNGVVDELRIYKRALSVKEINLLYKGLYVEVPEEDRFLKSGSSFNIKWTGEGVSAVDLLYSIDNGKTWSNIISNLIASTYQWTVPATLTDSLLIRVANHALPSQYNQTSILSIVNNELNYGLYAYYPLNGNVNDASGKGNDARTYGTSDTTDINGFSKRALFFDSNTDSLVVNSTVTPFRTGKEGIISLWVREANWATPTSENLVINRRDAGISQFQLNLHEFNGVGVHFRYGTWGSGAGDQILTSGQSRNWVSNSWHHIAIRWKNNGVLTYLSLFTDGMKVGETSTTLYIDEAANWLIGCPHDGTSKLNGTLDEVRFYNKALSDDFVSYIYQDGLPVKITVPEEGTDVIISTQQTVKWHVPYGISNINIDFSSDNGKNWTSVASNISTSLASTIWNVPSQTSDSCLFRTSIPSYPTTYFRQNRLFRILSDSAELNLVYYYKLNGNAGDSSGRSFHGTLHGGALTSGIGYNASGAYSFNGTSDYLEVPASATTGLNRFTFSCWVKTTEMRMNDTYWNRPHIFGNSTPSASDSDFGIITNGGYLGVWTGLNYTDDKSGVSKFFISDNNWHNVVCTYDGLYIKLYVDGKDINCSLLANKALNNYGYWLMAQHNHLGGASYYHQGTIDEVKFYSKVLDTVAIKKLFSKFKPLNILTPIHHQDIAVGTALNITWQAPENVTGYNLEYSANKGQSWTTVTTSISASAASYTYTLPSVVNDSCIIRLTAKRAAGNISEERLIRAIRNKSFIDLYAWYPFNYDYAGIVADSSGYGHDGTVNGAKPSVISGSDKAFMFDGINDRIELPNIPAWEEFTFTSWYKTSNTMGTIYSLPHAGYISVNTTDLSNPGKIVAAVERPAGQYVIIMDTMATNDDKWHFVALSVKRDTIKLYVDMRLIKFKLSAGTIDYQGSTAVLGMWDEVSPLYYKGLIDDVRLYKASLDTGSLNYIHKMKGCFENNLVLSVNTNQSVCAGTPVTLTATGNATKYVWNGDVTNGVSFKPANSSSYTVTATDNFGCTKTASVNITVKALPVVNAGNDTAVCKNGNIVLLAKGDALYYLWNNNVLNGAPFKAATSSSYIVTGTSTNGCSKNDTVNVIVNQVPQINAGTDTTICKGTEVTLTATGGVSYVWNSGNINGSPFIPFATASYVVTGTGDNGCSSIDTVKVSVNNCQTSIDDFVADLGISVYPNPSIGHFNIKVGDLTKITEIKIYNSQGELIRIINTLEEDMIINNLSKGLYLIKVCTQKGIFTHKQIIN